MGLFATEDGYQEEDYKISSDVAKRITSWWNSELCDMWGFKLELSLQSLEDCCTICAKLFDEKPFYFARPPGPFKRVAAFLVVGCLYPFWGFKPHVKVPSRRLALPISDHEKRVWHVRFLLMCLPYLFYRLRVKVNGVWEPLVWDDFPSDHYKLEFMNWLTWLDKLSDVQDHLSKHVDWDDFQKKRLARMVMATALALEASFYSKPSYPNGIQGKITTCMKKLTDAQLENLNFFFVPGN